MISSIPPGYLVRLAYTDYNYYAIVVLLVNIIFK